MRTLQYAMRGWWTESIRTGPSSPPTERQMCTSQKVFWGRDVDPVNGMDPGAMVGAACTFAKKLDGELGETGWGLNVCVDTRLVDRFGDDVTVAGGGSWENLATVVLVDGEPKVTYPQDERARNVEQVRAAVQALAYRASQGAPA